MKVVKTLVTAILQLAGALVVTLLLSFVVPDMGAPEVSPVLFVLAAGTSFYLGIAAVGLLAVRIGWLPGATAYGLRLGLALVGVFAPLVLALFLDQIRVASPFFTVAMVVGILGFHAGGWLTRNEPAASA